MVIIPIKSDIDVFKARRAGRELARKIGFNSMDYSFVEITVSELATNIVKHGIEGTISVEQIEGGLEIVSDDRGPGIEDIEKALKGKKKNPAGLGIGLLGVKGMMDQVEIISEKGRGTKVIARKWKVRPPHLIRPKRDYNVPTDGLMKYGVISIPAYGLEFNGDTYAIKEFDKKALIAVIDGLGHGEDAYIVSQKAADYIQKNYMQSLTSIIEGCHKAIHRTRGVVIGLARVDFERSSLAYAGIGNIGIKVVGKKTVKPVSLPGIVGHRFRKSLEEEFPYSKGDTIFMYSDGISSRFNPEKTELKGTKPQKIAEDIVREFGKDSDDTTIVVAREE